MRALAAVALCLLAALRSFGECENPFFIYLTPVHTGQDPQSIAVGDFNKDGKLDLVTTSSTLNSVSVFAGIGDGTFPAVAPTYAVGSGPVVVRVAEFNGDTWPDLVTFDGTGNTVSVLLNNQDGTFATAVTTATGLAGAFRLVAGDVDGDGKADVALTGSTQFRILYGNGDGTFSATASTLSPAGAPQDLGLADFDGDGKLDVVDTADAPGMLSRLEVWRNELPAGFTRTTYAPPNALSYRLLASDFNADNKADVAMTTNLGTVMFLNDGSGGLTFFFKFNTFTTQRHMALADVSEDGVVDIIEPGEASSGGGIAQYFSVAKGPFNRDNFSGGGTDVVAGDFDHDGRQDWAAVQPSLNQFVVALNACEDRYVSIASTPSANPSLYKDPVTFTVTVTPREPFMARPTGTVSISGVPATLTPVPGLNAATAMVTITSLHIGSNDASVNYSGDALYGPKFQGFMQMVNRRPFSTPLDFTATQSNGIRLSWTNSAGVDRTEIWRLEDGIWSLYTPTTEEVYTDTNVSPTKTYGYRIRSVAPDNSVTAFTYHAIGTTSSVGFAPSPGNFILASHIPGPRTLVNQLRATAGLTPVTFTDPNVFGVSVKAIHIDEMRNALDSARIALDLPPWPYFQPAITGGGVTTVFARDIREIRDATTKRE
ncbi:MAG TPA: FG-GAP-like repeat-containing protein [Thermoanaerobaculia bacterium]|nr:FG-GAP-like repeat-containing protein [Thermoanaerobaculia bacterium]